MQTTTSSPSRARVIVIGIILVLGAIVLFNKQMRSFRPDTDCIEWGVEKTDANTGQKTWAPTNAQPKDREEAERMAKELEASESTARYYYDAKCKSWKQ